MTLEMMRFIDACPCGDSIDVHGPTTLIEPAARDWQEFHAKCHQAKETESVDLDGSNRTSAGCSPIFDGN